MEISEITKADLTELYQQLVPNESDISNMEKDLLENRGNRNHIALGAKKRAGWWGHCWPSLVICFLASANP